MTAKKSKTSRLTQALLDTAQDMKDAGILDHAAYEKITLRHLGEKEKAVDEQLKAEDIRSMREQAHMSQAVFAHYLNVSPGYVSQLERGVKRPAGAALALLKVIHRKGISVVM